MNDGVRAFSRFFLNALAAFFVLSAADFLLTWKLIAAEGGEVAEINPIAAWMLTNFGWSGMGAYKVALVGAIGAVVLLVHWRQPRVGESLLVFGCGAQVAIVVASLLLLREKGDAELPLAEYVVHSTSTEETLQSLPPHALDLLALPTVQRELQLSDDLVQDISILLGQRRKFRQKLRNSNPSDLVGFYQEQLAQEKSLAWSLSSRQLNRLEQISWQVRGSLAFYDSKVMDTLRITQDQMDRMSAIHDEEKIESFAGPVKSRSVGPEFERARARLLAVLDSNQHRQWIDMQGAPFNLEKQIAVDFPAPWRFHSE